MCGTGAGKTPSLCLCAELAECDLRLRRLNDIINLAGGNFCCRLFYIDGGTGTDTINLTTKGDGQSIDFTVGTIANIENLIAVNQGSSNGYNQTFTVTASPMGRPVFHRHE